MHTLKKILLFAVFTTLTGPSFLPLRAQDVNTRFNVNTDAAAFPATTFGKPNNVSIRYSPKGTYLFIQSEHEVKCFEAATGRLVYRSNGGKDIPGFTWTSAYKLIDYIVSDQSLVFTPDEKYLRIHPQMKGGYENKFYYQYIDLATGIPVPEGPLYKQLDMPAGDKPEVQARIARNRYLKADRPYSDKGRPEATSWLWEMPDPEDSSRILALFQQDYLGTKSWRKSLHPDWDNAQFKREEQRLMAGSFRLEYGDFHYASLGKTPGDMIYKGSWRKGITGVDLKKVKQVVAVTPDGRYAVVIADNRNLWDQILEGVEIKTGKVLWTRPDGEFTRFVNMNAFNNIFVSRMDHTTKTGYASLIDIRTGELLSNKEIPYIFYEEQSALSPYDGTMAIIHFDRSVRNTDNTPIALTIHDVNTGKVLLMLSDEAAYLEYANRLKKDFEDRARDIEKANEEYQAYRRKQQELEQQRWAERAKQEEALYQADLVKHKNDCSACNGSGRTPTRPSYITKKVISDGGTYKVVQSQRVYLPSNPLMDWQPCARCNGKGKTR